MGRTKSSPENIKINVIFSRLNFEQALWFGKATQASVVDLHHRPMIDDLPKSSKLLLVGRNCCAPIKICA